MDKTPFIFSQELFQNFVNLLAELFNKKYDASKGEALAITTKSLEDNKVDKEEGKGLSTNDYTDEDKEKLDSLDVGAEKNVITGIYYKNSENLLPVENGYVTVPGVSEDDLPTVLPNEYPINVYNDDASAVVSYNGAEAQTLTAYSFFKAIVIKLLAARWNSKTYIAPIENLHIDSILFVSPSPNNMSAYAEYGIKAEVIYSGQLHFSCLETPEEDIFVYVVYSSPPRESDGTIILT